MARHNLTSGNSTEKRSSYATETITIGADRVVLAFVVNVQDPGTEATIPALVGNGLNWQRLASVQIVAAPHRRLTCFRAVSAAPIPGPATFDFSGQLQADFIWSIFEYDDINLIVDPDVTLGVRTNTLDNVDNIDVLLPPLTHWSKSIVVGAVMLNVPGQTVFSGDGLTTIHEQILPDGQGSLQTQDRTGGGSSVSWSWQGLQRAAAIVVEVQPVPISDLEKLVRRFEPIMFFHPVERFFPSCAKRYLEHCALWNAETPFDVKDAWGGKGTPFPRQPLIGKGQIAALPGEGGTPLRDHVVKIVPGQSEIDQFLDLTGWKDADHNFATEVTDTSRNIYSNRDPIAFLYTRESADGGDPQLRNSRYWYHAEFLDKARLRFLLGTRFAPDLVKVLDSLQNAALLNYYFFFAANEQPASEDCTNIEAEELGSYGGSWQCMSILLQRSDPASAYQPAFIGLTGRLSVKASDAGSIHDLAQAAAEDDGALRTFMKVEPFQRVEGFDDHPVLFVGLGTHSLYSSPRDFHHQVGYPVNIQPYNCGRYDAPIPFTPKEHDPAKQGIAGVGVFLAKLLAGGLLGIGTLGLVPSIYWIANEDWSDIGSGIDIVGIGPDPDVEETGQHGQSRGIVLRPTGVDIPDIGGAGLMNWRSEQGLVIDGRKYDFLVDRETQPWWPLEAGEEMTETRRGYNGRWGPLVENDPLGRRAGMRFPPFWQMFFLAYAKGKDAGVL